MISLFYLMFMNNHQELLFTEQNSSENSTQLNQKQMIENNIPSLELLLFLAEWEDSESDLIIDPDLFIQDTEVIDLSDNSKQNNENENTPDNS